MAVGDRRRLGRELQMARGLYWGFGANGDLYSMLLSGRDDDPWTWYERLRAAGRGPYASRAGTWVVGDHRTAAEVLADPRFTHDPPDAARWMQVAHCPAASWAGPFREFYARTEDVAPVTVDAEWLQQRCARLLTELGSRFDLVNDFAREVPVLALGTAPVLKGVDPDRLRSWTSATRVCLDAQVSPQQLAVTEQASTALDEIDAVTGGRDAAVLVGVVAELVANTVGNAVLAVTELPELAARLADDPQTATRVVTEVSRTSPGVHLERRTAASDLRVGGVDVPAGGEVTVVVAAANRDPEVFTDPDRFDVDRDGDAEILSSRPGSPRADLDALVATLATAALRAAAPVLPRLSRPGPVIRRRRSPVARGLSRCPVEL
ncbi:cytochrome P450 family protein [Micromonospora sp. SH-82]|uniref:cytochrome P450 family protein n=1 Tax=Micromonospora sp. SH-82 TaxID=3132938 RepID=UPI003EC0A624